MTSKQKPYHMALLILPKNRKFSEVFRGYKKAPGYKKGFLK